MARKPKVAPGARWPAPPCTTTVSGCPVGGEPRQAPLAPPRGAIRRGPGRSIPPQRLTGRLLVVASLLGAPPAAAQAPGEGPAAVTGDAAGLYRDAREAYGRGDYGRAASLLRQLIALQPDPDLLWNLGRAEEKAGNPVAAIDAYVRFLATNPPEGDRAEAAERLAAVKAALGRGWLSVGADAFGATARIDGAPAVTLPVERLLLAAGDHSITVEAPGRAPATVTAAVPSGEAVAVDVALELVAVALPPPLEDDLEPWAWATFGTGLALAAGGATLLALGRMDAAAVEDGDKDAAGRITSVSRAEALELADSAAVKSDAGVALLALGGGALATSVVLFVLDADDGAPTALAPALWPGGVALGGRF